MRRFQKISLIMHQQEGFDLDFDFCKIARLAITHTVKRRSAFYLGMSTLTGFNSPFAVYSDSFYYQVCRFYSPDTLILGFSMSPLRRQLVDHYSDIRQDYSRWDHSLWQRCVKRLLSD